MKLINLIDYSLVLDTSGTNVLFSFTITIPKDAYIEHMYIVSKDNLTVESDLTDTKYDIVNTMVNLYPMYNDAEEWFSDAFTKVYEDDDYSTYIWNNEYQWLDADSNTYNGIVIDNLYFLSLRVDTLTEAKYNSNCDDAKLTIPVYNRTLITSDIVKMGRLLNCDCNNCSNIPEGLIKKIMEFRVFEAAVENEDYLMVKKLYEDLYVINASSSSTPFTLNHKCNCNG